MDNNSENKIDSSPNGNLEEVETKLDFKVFNLNRILNDYDNNCSFAIEGKFGESEDKAVVLLQNCPTVLDALYNGYSMTTIAHLLLKENLESLEDKAVVLLHKLPFKKEEIEKVVENLSTSQTLFKNDVYLNQVAHLPPELNEIRVNTIYPADEKHIKKYEKQPCSFIIETPEMYRDITRPYMESMAKFKKWVYNILEHKSESERIVCEDPDPGVGFILLPDMKWTGEQTEDLYLQALVVRRDILSLRDLRGCHLPLLNNILEKCTKVIRDKYAFSANKLRVYIHYQPSYYHLHIHFTALSFDAPGTWAGKAHLLSDVINNLEIDSDYYQKRNISFTMKDNHPLAALLEPKKTDSEGSVEVES